MRGEIISREYQKIEWVHDENGKEYACYSDGVASEGNVNDVKEGRCLDLSLVLGDSW